MNNTVITSKGTTTIPKKFRDRLGLKEGSVISFGLSESGRLYIDPVISIEELRKKNQQILSRNKQSLKGYKSGDGFKAHIKATNR